MTLTQLLLFLIIGAIAGWAASKIIRGTSMGLLGNIVVGIVGAFLGAWIFGLLNITVGGNIIGSLITATIGAIVLLWLVKLVR